MKRADLLRSMASIASIGAIGGVAALPRAARAADRQTPAIAVGKPFPLLSVVARDGTTYDVPASDGRPTLIAIFASDCGPCRIDMPRVAVRVGRLAERLFTIGFDLTESDDAAAAYIKKANISFPVATLATTDKDFFGGGILLPSFLFIDKAGVIRDLWSGANDTDERDPLLGHLQKVGLN
jgi:thiol-disulfide isomerase/thioredoxin